MMKKIPDTELIEALRSDSAVRLVEHAHNYPHGCAAFHAAARIEELKREVSNLQQLLLADCFCVEGETPQSVSKWDLRFLHLARIIASWSKDPSTQVGAVIVDGSNRIVSVGYNGFPKGVEDSVDRYADRELKYKLIVHAERNALLFSRQSTKGCTIYTWPFQPCSACAGMLIQAGIVRVVAPRLAEGPQKERWKADMDVAVPMLEEAGVQVDLFDLKIL